MHQENGGLFDQKERYSYENYLSQIEGARLNVIPKRPEIEYVRAYDPKRNSPHTMTQAMAESFIQDMKTAKKRPACPTIEDKPPENLLAWL